MIKFPLSRAAVGAALLALAGVASAGTVAVSVDSRGNSLVGGVADLTGVFLIDNQSFSVAVDPNELWDNAGTDPTYLSNANGHDASSVYHPNFLYTADGLTAPYGSLVGEIGNGAYFLVGTSFSGAANATGELKLLYWDSDSANNIGQVTANITAVPEPANIALLGLALGAFALTRRRKA